MKPFSVNKQSWHYKMNTEMCKTNDSLKQYGYAEKFVQSKDNFCSYWRMTLFSIFKVLVVVTFVLMVASLILFVLYNIGSAFIYNTAAAFVTTGVVLSLFVFSICIALLSSWFGKRRSEKLQKILHNGETETSLAKTKYSSWKNGICLPVEFKE
jgi:hypothetical protein